MLTILIVLAVLMTLGMCEDSIGTVAVRIAFDDSRSLGSKETGGRVALPVFQEVMLKVYRDRIVGPVPAFPDRMEQRITQYLQGGVPAPVAQLAARSLNCAIEHIRRTMTA